MTAPTIDERVLGALLGLAGGDALGATLEFCSAEQIAARYGRHRDIVGGGMFGWRPGQGTDDTDLAVALARTYAVGYRLDAAADGFLAWYETCPRDIGGTTRTALAHYQRHRNPTTSGIAAIGPTSAGNGSLMRALATGLVRTDPVQRASEAAEISAITHADPRCIDSCIAYVDIVAHLLDGHSPAEAVAVAAGEPARRPDVCQVLTDGPRRTIDQLRPTGYVLDTLEVGVWALCQDTTTLEDALVDVVNLGGDADTTGAVAGGLLGARHGANAVPERWRSRLEYATECGHLAAQLADARP